MPGMRGWIKRPRAIVLKGYGEDGEAKERQFEANFCFFGFFFLRERTESKRRDSSRQTHAKHKTQTHKKPPCFQTPHPCFLSICDTQKARTPVFKHRTPAFSPCVSE